LNEGRRGSLRLLLIVQLTQNIRGGIISPILALFIRGHGLSVSQIGFLGIAGMLGWFIFEPLSGVVADRIRKKYMIIFAIVSSTVIYASYPMASSIWHFAVLAFFMSSVMSAYAVSVKAMTAELLPESDRGRTYGRYLSAISMGGVVAPFIGGWVSANFGYTLPFYISASVGLVSLALVLLMRYDDKAPENSKPLEESAKGEKLMTKPFISILVVRMIFMFNLLFRQNFLPIYLNESPNYQASETEIGAFMTVVRVTSALSQAVLGDLNDRFGSEIMIVGGVGLLGLSYLVMGYGSGDAILYALAGVQGILMAAANMSMMIHLMAIMPEGRTGMVMGLYSEAENVGGIVASPALGVIYDSVGPLASLYTVTAILVLDAVLTMILIRRKAERSRDAAHEVQPVPQ
jgi:MFS family permease